MSNNASMEQSPLQKNCIRFRTLGKPPKMFGSRGKPNQNQIAVPGNDRVSTRRRIADAAEGGRPIQSRKRLNERKEPDERGARSADGGNGRGLARTKRGRGRKGNPVYLETTEINKLKKKNASLISQKGFLSTDLGIRTMIIF